MYARAFMLAVASILTVGGCTESRELVGSAGQWDVEPGHAVVAFYGASTNHGEAQLHSAAESYSRTWLEKYDRVTVVILYDGKYARQLASPATLKRVAARGVGPSPGEMLMGSERLKGGACWTVSKGKPEGDWAFEPLWDVKAGDRDKAFAR